MLSNIDISEDIGYGFASTLLKAKERLLLTDSDYMDLIETQMDTFLSMLIEKGYRSHTDRDKIDFEHIYQWEMWHIHKLLKELCSLNENEGLLTLLFLKNDCINFKLLCKEWFLKGSFEEEEKLKQLPLNNIGIFTHNSLYTLLKSGKSECHESLGNAYKEISEYNKNDLYPGIIDAIIDQEFFKAMFSISKQLNSDFLTQFFNVYAVLLNCKNIFRLESSTIQDFKSMYIPNSLCPISLFTEMKESGQNIYSVFLSYDFYSVIAPVLMEFEKTKDLSNLEKDFENILTVFLHDQLQDKFFHLENLFAYLWAKEIELKNIKIIYIGKKNKVEKEKITKLIRKAYA